MSIERNDHADTIRAMARHYNQAAGNAFARGDDKEAGVFREAAKKLEALAAELPPLPVTTR